MPSPTSLSTTLLSTLLTLLTLSHPTRAQLPGQAYLYTIDGTPTTIIEPLGDAQPTPLIETDSAGNPTKTVDVKTLQMVTETSAVMVEPSETAVPSEGKETNAAGMVYGGMWMPFVALGVGAAVGLYG